MAELQAEQKRKALEEEQKLAQEQGPILGAMFPPTELQDLQSSVVSYSVPMSFASMFEFRDLIR